MAENRNFFNLLQARWDKGCNVCVGLDTNPRKLPSSVPNVHAFNVEMIKATAPFACAFKPNAAFYEANGAAGWGDLEALTDYARSNYPEIPLILDAKRGDNVNSNAGYVQSIFDHLGFDAVTVQPYMGSEPLKPFLERADRGIIVLTRTSNPGAGEFQDLDTGLSPEQVKELALGPCGSTPNIEEFSTGMSNGVMLFPLHQVVALRVANHWNTNGNCAVVAGATCPIELKAVRRIIRDMAILIPGIGVQGGSLESAVANGINSKGDGMIINASRSITYASCGDDFAKAAHAEAGRLNAAIQTLRN